MIIVTGPGRSGTSFVASLYRNLGFDPGGKWFDESQAGLESEDVVEANGRILRGLHIRGVQRQLPSLVLRLGQRVLSSSSERRLRASLANSRLFAGRTPRLIDWARFDEVVARSSASLRAIADRHEVVKDPRFCLTLGVWAASGLPIEHVLVCVRSLDASVKSRMKKGDIAPRSAAGAKNMLAYQLGMCLAACHDYRIPHDVVRFPDFLDHPDVMYETMRFPRPVPRERFLEVFARETRLDLVHER